MNKIVGIVALAAIVGATSFSAARGQDGSPKLSREEAFLKRTGGFISIREPGAAFVFADARKDKTPLDAKIFADMERFAEIPIVSRAIELDSSLQNPYAIAQSLLADSKEAGAVAVLFEGLQSEPVLTAWPENRIATINVTPLFIGVSIERGKERLEKELWRALCFAASGVNAQVEYCVLKTVLKPSDLDRIECRMANPEATANISENAHFYGFGRIRTATYRTACNNGWAPAPTNDYQRAIWERANAEKEKGPDRIRPIRRQGQPPRPPRRAK